MLFVCAAGLLCSGPAAADPINFGPAQSTLLPNENSTDLAFADLNGDGKRDVVVANSGSVSILKGNGDGTVTAVASFASAQTAAGVAVADVNSDGKPDIVYSQCCTQAAVIVRTNSGGFSFSGATQYGLKDYPSHVTLGDLTGDGDPELVVGQVFASYFTILRGQPGSAFGSPTDVAMATGAGPFGLGGGAQRPMLGDVAFDSRLDLISPNVYSATATVRANAGSGFFGDLLSQSSEEDSLGAVLTEVNGDTRPDLVVTHFHSSSVSVYHGGSNGFADRVTFGTGRGAPGDVDAGKMNGDAYNDLIVAHVAPPYEALLLQGGPGGALTPAGYVRPAQDSVVRVADMNNDGRADLVTAGYKLEVRLSTVDSTPPALTISGLPPLWAGRTVPMRFFADESADFVCQLDGPGSLPGTPGPCTSPKTYTNVPDGSYTFKVRATDPSGNVSNAQTTFTVDATPPDTTIETGPSGTVGTPSASFTFSATEPAGFLCDLQGPTPKFAECSSPVAYSGLADGNYTLSVYATDAAGNEDASPATRSFTVNTTPPGASITSGPSGFHTSRTAAFAFGSTTPGATFECRLDGPAPATGTFSSCTSPKTYTNVADGAYTFRLRVTAPGGAISTELRTFTVDATPPDTSVTSGPSGFHTSRDATFGFSATEGATYQCRLDGPIPDVGTFAPCNGNPKTYTGLADGAYTFLVKARDAAGNEDPTPAARAFTVDATVPDTSIDSGPSGFHTSRNASFGFSATEGATYQCRLDGPIPAVGTFAPCNGNPKSYTNLADGAYTFFVKAKDAAGNEDASPALRTFTVDATPPVVSIADGPTGTIDSRSTFLSFTASEAVAFECKLDGPGATTGTFALCASPRPYGDLADGAYTFAVRGTDAAGNLSAAVTRAFTVAAPLPEVVFSGGPSGFTTERDAEFTFDTPGASTVECRLDGPIPLVGEFAPCVSPKSYDDLEDGAYTFWVRAANGNGPTTVPRTFSVDATPPDTSIDSGPASTIGGRSATFEVSTVGASGLQCRLVAQGGGPVPGFETCESPRTYTDLADGAYLFEAAAVDPAGNVDPTPATRSFEIDNRPPGGNPQPPPPAGPTGQRAAALKKCKKKKSKKARKKCKKRAKKLPL